MTHPLPPAACPDPDLLRRLAAGETDDSIPDTILTHLEVCEPCSDVFGRVAPPLADHLRAPATVTDDGELAAVTARAAALVAAAPAAGQTVGRFVLAAVVGRGGMGVVYRATDTTLDREVALKLIRTADGTMTAVQKARFLREARAVGRLQHDHIAPVYEAGEADGTPYMVMPLLDGQTLAERLAAGPLPPAEVCRLGGQIAAGLADAHAAGLVHRDVKPSNVFVEVARGGTARLLDFGLAKSPTEVADGLTGSYALAGTPPYMSPEQADAGPVDVRSDLFGLGCVLYEMANGARLFADGPDRPPVLAQVRRFAGLRPAEAWPGGPRPVAELIAKLLQPRPADRPASAAEVAEQLRSAVAEPAPVRRWPWRAAAAGLMAASVAAVVLWQVTVRIRTADGGKDVTLRPPPGATVTVDGNGNAEVTVPTVAKPERSAVADPGADFLESSAYLPFGDGVPRKVTDYLVVTDKTPAELVHWARSLGPGFVPVAFGQHAAADDPPMLHAVAVRQTGGCPKFSLTESGFDPKDPLKESPLLALWTPDRRHGPTVVRLDIEGAKMGGVVGVKNTTFPTEAEDFRKLRRQPTWITPECRLDPTITFAGWRPAPGGGGWDIRTECMADELDPLVHECCRRNQYFAAVHAYRTVSNKLRFSVLTAARPDERDWYFLHNLDQDKLIHEVARQKAEGFYPTSITSYGAVNDPRYAVCWVRYRPRPYPNHRDKHWADLAIRLPAPPAGKPLDSRAFLPFSENVGRPINDFSVALDLPPEALFRWAGSIDREYVPVSLTTHPTANPSRVHGVAVRLAENAPPARPAYSRDRFPDWSDRKQSGWRTIQHSASQDDHINEYFLELRVQNDIGPWWHFFVPVIALNEHAAGMRKDHGVRPVLFNPHYYGSHMMAVFWTADHGRKRWRYKLDLTSDSLTEYVQQCQTDKLYVSTVTAYRDGKNPIRYGVVALENLDSRDTRFRYEMTRAAFVDALTQYKLDGFCPLSITSAGSGDAERYAASWIRFVIPDK